MIRLGEAQASVEADTVGRCVELEIAMQIEDGVHPAGPF